MKTPRDTTKEVSSNPPSFLAAAMAMGTSGAIEHQEAQGQGELVRSQAIPYRGSNGESRPVLESWGFKFGEHDGKDLFIQVQLPEGWKKVASDHSMWSHLVDDKGRERGSIFYKAAFYDRDAFMNLSRRFSVQKNYDGGAANSVEVKDCGKVIHTIPFPSLLAENADREARLSRYNEEDALVEAAKAWLAER